MCPATCMESLLMNKYFADLVLNARDLSDLILLQRLTKALMKGLPCPKQTVSWSDWSSIAWSSRTLRDNIHR